MTAVLATRPTTSATRASAPIGYRPSAEQRMAQLRARGSATAPSGESHSAIASGVAPERVSAVPTTRLRITRRGRAVLSALVSVPIVAILIAIAIFGPSSAVATGAAGSGAFGYVTVGAGETLWGIAEELAPSADPRDVISSIVSLNQLQSSTVQPGQRLAIPAAYSD